MADIIVTNDKIVNTEISSEMKRAYLNYAMSVIVSRALPDVRDGLKPVHRRILYGMHRLGLDAGGRYSKSAKVVGEVMGKYHPHGDSSIYEAIVRMAQTFSMRYPLVKGQGNFGSVDGDSAAAMRYTEVKLAKIAEEMLFDLDKNTIIWEDNFDASLKEPRYLPAKLPNLLLMGAEGIAVGMATRIPPHNLGEIVDACCLLIDQAKTADIKVKNPNEAELLFESSLDDVLEIVKGPDFPTGGLIYGASDIKEAYATGRGKMVVRAKVEQEELKNGKEAIVITEIPFQVNKSHLVEKIANLVHDKKLVGISDLRDESDKDGIRVVVELKKDAAYKKVLNNLFKYTEMQTSFPLNMVVLVDGTPQTLSVKSILEYYVKHRVQIVTRRSEYELAQAKHRAHILEGLLIALDNIDEVIEIIKKSKNEPEAKEKLMAKFKLSDIQTQAILDMQLKRLTGLERAKIENELKELKKIIDYLEDLLKDVFKVLSVIKNEILEIKTKYGDARRTRIFKNRPDEFTEEELIENKEVIIMLTKEGYIKHIPKETFKVQNRGGKGVAGVETKEQDDVYYITSAMTHDSVLFFTNKGKVYQNRVWEIPQGSRTSKGKAIVNVINITADEKITSVLTQPKEGDKKGQIIFMCTKFGTVKKTALSEFDNIRQSGIISIKLEENDELMWVKVTDGKQLVVLASKNGKAIVFGEEDVRSTGRSSIGVRGIRLEGNDVITSMDTFDPSEKNKKLMVISENGIGKKSKILLFREQGRGGKGVKISNLDEKTGSIAFSSIIDDEEKTLLITSKKGQVVKMPLKTIPDLSRTAKGVILMRFSDKTDKVASATFI